MSMINVVVCDDHAMVGAVASRMLSRREWTFAWWAKSAATLS